MKAGAAAIQELVSPSKRVPTKSKHEYIIACIKDNLTFGVAQVAVRQNIPSPKSSKS